jgi:hypothetical protein
MPPNREPASNPHASLRGPSTTMIVERSRGVPVPATASTRMTSEVYGNRGTRALSVIRLVLMITELPPYPRISTIMENPTSRYFGRLITQRSSLIMVRGGSRRIRGGRCRWRPAGH